MLLGKINQKVCQEHIKTKRVWALRKLTIGNPKHIILMWITEVTTTTNTSNLSHQIFMWLFRMTQSHSTIALQIHHHYWKPLRAHVLFLVNQQCHSDKGNSYCI